MQRKYEDSTKELKERNSHLTMELAYLKLFLADRMGVPVEEMSYGQTFQRT